MKDSDAEGWTPGTTSSTGLGGSGVVEIDIPSSFELVTVVRMLVATAATASGSLHGDRLDDLRWVTSEAVTNAIQANHAKAEHSDQKPARVRARCVVGEDFVQLTVTDQGAGMPEEVIVPPIDHPDRLQIEGGFGVPLMRHLSRGDITFDSSAKGTTVCLELRQD